MRSSSSPLLLFIIVTFGSSFILPVLYIANKLTRGRKWQVPQLLPISGRHHRSRGSAGVWLLRSLSFLDLYLERQWTSYLLWLETTHHWVSTVTSVYYLVSQSRIGNRRRKAVLMVLFVGSLNKTQLDRCNTFPRMAVSFNQVVSRELPSSGSVGLDHRTCKQFCLIIGLQIKWHSSPSVPPLTTSRINPGRHDLTG